MAFVCLPFSKFCLIAFLCFVRGVFRFVLHTVKPPTAELLLLATLPWMTRYKNDYFHKKCNRLGNPRQTLIAFDGHFWPFLQILISLIYR